MWLRSNISASTHLFNSNGDNGDGDGDGTWFVPTKNAHLIDQTYAGWHHSNWLSLGLVRMATNSGLTKTSALTECMGICLVGHQNLQSTSKFWPTIHFSCQRLGKSLSVSSLAVLARPRFGVVGMAPFKWIPSFGLSAMVAS